MSKKLPFTIASMARAIKGVESSGLFVVGVKPDGTLIVADKPLNVASLLPVDPPDSKWEDTPPRRFGDRLNGGQDPARPRRLAEKINGGKNEPTSKWEDKPAGAPAQREGMATPPRAHDIPRTRRGGGWGAPVTIDDPNVIESYRAAGLKVEVYKDGELAELIRKSAMGKRETAALEGFFRAQGEPVDVKGAGLHITRRLVTRGYIEIAEGSKHRITPAGEAEWLRLANKTSADQP